MSTEADKALVERFYEEVLTKRNPELVDEFCTPDYVYHATAAPPKLATGREGFKQFVTEFLSGYPNLQFAIKDQTVEGDKVITHLTARSSTPVGPVMTIPADPQAVAQSEELQGTTTDRIVNGKIAESWIQFDVPNPLPQLEETPLEGRQSKQ